MQMYYEMLWFKKDIYFYEKNSVARKQLCKLGRHWKLELSLPFQWLLVLMKKQAVFWFSTKQWLLTSVAGTDASRNGTKTLAACAVLHMHLSLLWIMTSTGVSNSPKSRHCRTMFGESNFWVRILCPLGGEISLSNKSYSFHILVVAAALGDWPERPTYNRQPRVWSQVIQNIPHAERS